MRKTALLLTVLLAVGCGENPELAATKTDGAPAGTAAASGLPAGDPGPNAAVQVGTLNGTVLETMNSGGYTYLKLKTAEGETWAAVNEVKVEVGQSVGILNPMPMDGFESKTLNRKFDHIVFGSIAGAEAAGAASAAAGDGAPTGMMGGAPDKAAGAMPAGMAAQHAAAATGGEVAERISVPRASGADAKTVAEVWAQHDALKGKTVTIRGKVVKYNSAIMGRNWLHLRDGSGSAEGKDNDITVTTNDAAAKGDVVVVTGVVAVDRDFGAGYTYPAIVEEAKVTK
ncbi:MAG: nucleotide-binding protein [Thermoanaerobaculia bacterium]